MRVNDFWVFLPDGLSVFVGLSSFLGLSISQFVALLVYMIGFGLMVSVAGFLSLFVQGVGYKF